MPVATKKRNELGMIHVYTGNGKGKTTASLGLALRAIGHGFNVCVVQFMKGGRYFGELAAAENLLKNNIQFAQFGQACPYAERIKKGTMKCGRCRSCFMTYEEEIEQAKKALDYAKKILQSKKYDVVILDEINLAMSRGHIPVDDVLKLIMTKHPGTELILTGRNAPSEIIAAADYVTEMKEIKHPFNKKRKITGRRGVEY